MRSNYRFVKHSFGRVLPLEMVEQRAPGGAGKLLECEYLPPLVITEYYRDKLWSSLQER